MLPQRIILAILAFLGIAVSTALRLSITIAITEMVKPVENNKMRNHTVVCSAATSISENITKGSHSTLNHGLQYSWTQEQQGILIL